MSANGTSNRVSTLTIRPALLADVPAITSIFNHYVQRSVQTFQTTPFPESEFLSRFHKIKEQDLPFLVASLSPLSPDQDVPLHDGTVIGYAYFSGFRYPMGAYAHTVELSIFLHPDHRMRGVGTALMNWILDIIRTHKPRPKQGISMPDASGTPAKPDGVPEPEGIREILCIMSVDVEAPKQGMELVKWYKKWGFKEVGDLKGVGWKFNRWIDVKILQLRL
ncbi:MAG: hypothetical protein M1824_005108 [Vezdaea acicularis]|nr:MAG: hypothetical protein M1824_005108 [Vezdaea acicularis]